MAPPPLISDTLHFPRTVMMLRVHRNAVEIIFWGVSWSNLTASEYARNKLAESTKSLHLNVSIYQSGIQHAYTHTFSCSFLQRVTAFALQQVLWISDTVQGLDALWLTKTLSRIANCSFSSAVIQLKSSVFHLYTSSSFTFQKPPEPITFAWWFCPCDIEL